MKTTIHKLTPAEENKEVCDQFLMDIAAGTDDITVYYNGLHTRQIISTDKKALEAAMQYLDCSFSFEAKEIFVDNAHGYEIELPRLIQD